jgi:hypothetical protein
MCINEKVSLSTFLICSLSCIYLFKRNNKNDRWVAIMFGYLGSMQLLEYLMWKDQECNGLNQFATDIGFIHNILQPLVSLLIAYYFTDGKLSPYIYILFIIYLTTSLPEIIKMKKSGQCSRPCNDGEVGLSWKYTNTNYPVYVWGIFCLAIIAPLLIMKGNGKVYGGIVMGLYILAHFISINRCPNNQESPPNGSWWCMMAALVPLVAIKINK